jgi:GAF domain-containing protein
MPSEGSIVSGDQSVEELRRELAEVREQQAATAEILRVISSSPMDLRRVFTAILECAVHLCRADLGGICRVENGQIIPVAFAPDTPEFWKSIRGSYPRPVDTSSILGRALVERKIIHVPDLQDVTAPHGTAAPQRLGIRSQLTVPLLGSGQPIGVLALLRRQPGPYLPAQISLVTTFADQALIAIENTRLCEAEQASKRELTEALEQQTATADVLKVISRSALDLQRVLDALAESAARLCNAYDAVIYQVFGDHLRLVAHHGQLPLAGPVGQLTRPLVRERIPGRAVIDRRAIHVADMLAEGDEYPESRKIALQTGQRTALAVPLVHAGKAIGVIFIRRAEVRPFTERQIELVNTFADQAVIAIENARLFEEVQARNRDLTALGEVGRAVSSTLDLKVVLKAIVNRAVELSGTDGGSIFYFRDDIGRFELGETTGLTNEVVERFRRLDIVAGQTGLGEAIASGKPLQIADITKRPSNPLRDAAMEAGLRAALIVPLLSSDGPLGALVLQRRRPGDFPSPVVSLMQNFADQSVIAIENGRLFNETKEALAQQTAAAEVLNVISNSVADARPVFKSIATACQTLFDSDQVVLSLVDDAGLVHHERGEWPPHVTEATAERQWAVLNAAFPRPLAQSYQSYPLRKRRVVHYPDIANGPGLPEDMRQIAREVGNFSALIAPMQTGTKDLGTIHVVRMPPRPFSDKEAVLLKGFADQAVIAIQNTRLFEAEQASKRETAFGWLRYMPLQRPTGSLSFNASKAGPSELARKRRLPAQSTRGRPSTLPTQGMSPRTSTAIRRSLP